MRGGLEHISLHGSQDLGGHESYLYLSRTLQCVVPSQAIMPNEHCPLLHDQKLGSPYLRRAQIDRIHSCARAPDMCSTSRQRHRDQASALLERVRPAAGLERDWVCLSIRGILNSSPEYVRQLPGIFVPSIWIRKHVPNPSN